MRHVKAHLSARDARLETAVLVASLVVMWEGVEVCGHSARQPCLQQNNTFLKQHLKQERKNLEQERKNLEPKTIP